ncbi:MAG: DUF3501 family protein [Acidobacteria bacterium]|nr:DUF3501 family protein [Acidobacteriota bacterium]
MNTHIRTIPRRDIPELGDYERRRDAIRASAITARQLHRVALGPNIILSFENRETLTYQVLEMVRAERIVKEPEIRHEIDTYSELLPAPDELSATMLIEFPEKGERDVRLVELLGLDSHLRVELDGAGSAPATFDRRQIDVERLSSVQFVRFCMTQAQVAALRAGTKLTIISDHPHYPHASVIPAALTKALVADLDDVASMEV